MPCTLGDSLRVYWPKIENSLTSAFLPSERHVPPTRRSLSTLVPRYVASSPHHARRCCGSIHAWNTRSGGATMSISTTRVSFIFAESFMSVRLSFLFDETLEVLEFVLPHMPVVREPVVDLLERASIELV